MMSKGRFLTVGITIALLVSLVPALSYAKTHAVGPGQQYQTIQEAIDAASNGDTVLIYDGVYTGEGNKNIDFKGKAIMVRSVNGIEHTIVDCEKDGRGFIFQSGEGSDSRLGGITIRNAYSRYRGGGILCTNFSSPTIIGMKFEDCSAGMGGAICADHSSPEINNCTIEGCEAAQHGGGIAIYLRGPKDYLIKNCSIKNNKAHSLGGGIFAGGGDKITHIRGCSIYGNEAARGGGAFCNPFSKVRIDDGGFFKNIATVKGAGVYVNGNATVLMNKVFVEENRAVCSGGGIYGYSSTSNIGSIFFAQGYIVGNQTEIGVGGGVRLRNTKAVFTSTVFLGNRHYAVAIDPDTTEPIVSADCEFSENSPVDFNY